MSTVNACSTRRTAPGSRGSRDRPTIWQLIDRASGEGRHVSLRPLGGFPEMHLHSVFLSFFTVESQFTVRRGCKQNDGGSLYISTVLYQMMKSCNWWTFYDAKMSPGTGPQSGLKRQVPTFRIFCDIHLQVGFTKIMRAACVSQYFSIKKPDKLRGQSKTISVLNYARKDTWKLEEKLHAFLNFALEGVHDWLQVWVALPPQTGHPGQGAVQYNWTR